MTKWDELRKMIENQLEVLRELKESGFADEARIYAFRKALLLVLNWMGSLNKEGK